MPYYNSKALEGLTLLAGKSRLLFFRVAGTGMGAAASLAKQQGFLVEGVDTQFFAPMGPYLESLEIPLYSLLSSSSPPLPSPYTEFKTKQLQEYDLIIVGNVVGKNSDQAKMIEESGIPFTSFPEFLQSFCLKTRRVIGVAGTHGKSSSCFLLVQLLRSLGLNPGYLIGAVLPEGMPSSFLGTDAFFIIEADEYDTAYFQKTPKFLHYSIETLLLTSLEFDHADIYGSLEEIQEQFRLLLTLPKTKYVIYGEKYQDNILKLFPSSGIEKIIPYKIQDWENWKKRGAITNLKGPQNIENLVGCSLLVETVTKKQLEVNSFFSLKLPKRRQQVRGSLKGVIYIDDFAHHPSAIELTIQGVKEQYPKALLSVVYEPASQTARSNYHYEAYKKCFTQANRLFLIEPKRPSTLRDVQKAGEELLKSENLVQELQKKNMFLEVKLISSLEQLESSLEILSLNISQEEVVLVLSNSNCLGFWDKAKFDENKTR